jgi:protein-ribulosamine 3-kinase
LSHNDPALHQYQDSPSSRLLRDAVRRPLEQAVSDYYNHAWRVQTFSDMHEFASHPSAILSDGSRSVFAKLSEAANASEQFAAELGGLRLLSERAGVLIPSPIGIVSVEGGEVLVLETVQQIARSARHWRDIGRTLAAIHQVRGTQCGLETQGYFGPLYQDNRPTPDWLTFYIERRLWPRLMGAVDSGHMSSETIRQVEKLIARLPGMDIPVVEPRLLHGDAQQNNYISTAAGAVVIDPAVYYGDPEMDLAYVDYFEDVPEDVFLGYQEILPIAPGFAQRRELWRVAAYLAMVQVEAGPPYMQKLTAALQMYL